MCLIVFDWQPEQAITLQLLANRDEFYTRASKSGHYWSKSSCEDGLVFGGQDLQAGGSWLAVSTTGRLAAVTNVREAKIQAGELSRGVLVSEYIRSQQTAQSYLQQLHLRSHRYGAFNLLLLDYAGLFYYSNREGVIHRLDAGVYGLCNHLLDTPWPKLTRLKQRMQTEPCSLQLLQDRHQPAQDELPDTGVGMTIEKQLAPIFIQSQSYGTRCSTWIQLTATGWRWQEQNFAQYGALLGPILTEYIPTDFA